MDLWRERLAFAVLGAALAWFASSVFWCAQIRDGFDAEQQDGGR